MILKIHKRKEHGEYDVVAKVDLDGNVEGDSHMADVVEREIENDINKIEDEEIVSIDDGPELLNRLEKRYSSGYYLSSYDKDGSIDKQSDGDDSHVPTNCDRQYIDDPSEAPEGARIYDGIEDEDAQFYCGNYTDVGAFSEDFLNDAQQRKEEINQHLDDKHKLKDNELLYDQQAQDVEKGQDVILDFDDDDEFGRAMIEGEMGEISSGEKKILVIDPDDDSKGAFIPHDDWDDEVEGVVVEGVEGELGGHWERYERPRELYTPQKTESKTPINNYNNGNGGANASSTYVAEFDNGEKAIYKPDPGNAHQDVLETDIAWYEAAERFIEDTSFVPETAASDLKRGFGSAQLWVDNATELREQRKDDDTDHVETIESNIDEMGCIAFMDYVIGNDDRHDRNMIVDEDDNIHAIDNGGYGRPEYKPTTRHAMDTMGQLSYLDWDERQDAFRSVIESQLEILEKIEENPEELVNIGRMVYGEDHNLTKRLRDMVEEEDNGKISLRNDFEEDLFSAQGNAVGLTSSDKDDVREDLL